MRLHARTAVFPLLALLALAAAACGGGAGETATSTSTPAQNVSDVSREEVLASLANGVFAPSYEQAATAGDQLTAAVEQLKADPNPQTLAAARDAWKQARLAWSHTLGFDFGPADTRRSMSLVDWAPVDPAKIENLIATRDSFTADDVVQFFGASERGLGAIEYILFTDDTDAQLLDSLQADGGNRMDFAVANAQAVANEMDAVSVAWTQDSGDDYAYRAVLAGEAPVSLFLNGAMREVVSSPVFMLQTVADMQLAPAVGLRGGGTDLSAMPSLRSEFSIPDIRSRLVSVRDVYVGAEGGMGISALVAQLSTDTDTRMRQALDDAIAAADAITLPVSQAATETPDDLKALFDRIKDVQRVLNTEVVSLLGVSTGFSDNDGDSSN